jgi:NADPH:quinone reductase-like Zn-dependent oxidoreductase
MKAVVIRRYGGNEALEIKDMPVPSPGPDDVLIKVHAASVNPVDWKVRYGHARIFTGGTFPKILGNECSGEVIEIGSRGRKFIKGDPVICYPGVKRLGAFAEYACAGEATTFPKPANLSFAEAACIPIAGLTALQALRDHGKIGPGKKVLINGASGGVGHFAVQIAKIFDAEVTAVSSGANADFVTDLGADRVIDYKRHDFTKDGERYDIIFDAVAKRSFRECKNVLASDGVYVSTLPSLSVIVNQYITGFFTSKKARSMWVKPIASDMEWIKTQIEGNRIRIVIGKVYPLDQAKEALAYSESGRARGKIVLTLI